MREILNYSIGLIAFSLCKADADLSMTSHQAKAATSKSKGGASRDIINARSIKLVIAGTGCENAEKVEEVTDKMQNVFIDMHFVLMS